MLSPEEQEVRKRLEEWRARFDRIEWMYDPQRGVLPRGRLKVTRELYTQLKRDLDAENRTMYRRRPGPPHPRRAAAEERWYQRSIHEAHVNLRARTNGAPEGWYESLRNARYHIDATLSEMRAEQEGR